MVIDDVSFLLALDPVLHFSVLLTLMSAFLWVCYSLRLGEVSLPSIMGNWLKIYN